MGGKGSVCRQTAWEARCKEDGREGAQVAGRSSGTAGWLSVGWGLRRLGNGLVPVCAGRQSSCCGTSSLTPYPGATEPPGLALLPAFMAAFLGGPGCCLRAAK